MKYCPKCKTYKELTEFVKDSRNKSGVQNECKTCCAKNSRLRRTGKDAGPANLGHIGKPTQGKLQAQRAVCYALRVGKIVRRPCEVCNSTQDVHAHHDDYFNQLNVRWLCRKHHYEWHREHGEGLNAI